MPSDEQLSSHSTCMQNEEDARRDGLEEMLAQQEAYDKQIAKVVSDASDRQAYSDDQMARAGLEAGFMKVAYDKLTSDNIEQQRTAAQVSI